MIFVAIIIPFISLGAITYMVFHAPEMNNDAID